MPKKRLTLGSMVLLALVVPLLSGCVNAVTQRSIGVEASSVQVIELYEYPWGSMPSTLDQLTIINTDANREVVEELVKMFIDMPTTDLGAYSGDAALDAALVNKETLAVRYTTRDGSSVEVTRIFVDYHDIIVIWPDESAGRTEWGTPGLMRYYAEFGETQEMDAALVPKVSWGNGS